MKAKAKDRGQMGFYSTFEEQLNHQHSLYILANHIQWQKFEDAFSKHYSVDMGAPAKPIRLMVSLLILKQVRNLSDESVVKQWAENSYYQYFSGEDCFCGAEPCSATELVEFRKRIGEEGVELILEESIRINGKDGQEGTLSADTTIQEKNITYPTDDKLYKKIIHKCIGIAEEEDIELRQSYRRTVKKLSIVQRLKRTRGGEGKARKANKKIKTIAGRLTRELERKLSPNALNQWGADLALFQQVLSQKRGDSNKIYSLHEPQVKCFSKGKEHKKYEFGSKASFLVTQKTGVIVGAMNFTDNLHDSKTLPAALEQHQRLTGMEAKAVYAVRGYAGLKKHFYWNAWEHLPSMNLRGLHGQILIMKIGALPQNPGLQDTNSVLAKYGVMTILRENPYLLSSDSILHHFYDSMITAPMGKILAIDSSINFSSSPLSVTTYTSLVSSLGSVVPANNIEANMQIVTADYLYFLRYDTLLLSALSNLRILANKCPDWDGVGVYEARGLLTYFDSVGTVYNDSCYSGPHALREPKKNSIGNTDFNLYPNPNNGGFTVSYQLFKGQTGYLTIYSMLGAKVAEFKLDANMDKMNINAGNLTEGIYLYGISINNTTVKRDKIIIIK